MADSGPSTETIVGDTTYRVVDMLMDVYVSPEHGAKRETQLLCGEEFRALERHDSKWARIHIQQTGTTGYARLTQNVKGGAFKPTHRVKSNLAIVYQTTDHQSGDVYHLPLNARVRVDRTVGKYAFLQGYGYVLANKLTPIDCYDVDFVSVAEEYEGAPYLWGGRTVLGIDCSGKIGNALLAACGRNVPHNSTWMRENLGVPVGCQSIRRGDLAFWSGHVGVMQDHQRLLHATWADDKEGVVSQNILEVIEERGERPMVFKRFSGYKY